MRALRSARPHGLVAHDVHVHFGGVRAVDGADLELTLGEIMGLIGPNGAGKTTLLNALSGFQRLSSGRVSLGDHDMTGLPPHRLARLGIARTFQDVRLFRNLSVLTNLEVGGLAVGLSRRTARERARAALETVDLGGRGDLQASSLSFGEERRLGLARAVVSEPSFLLLDEPAAGLNDVETGVLMETIDHVRKSIGCGVLLVEHDMKIVMGLCERIQVLDSGRTISIGTPDEVQSDERVISAYLGTKGRNART